MCAYPIPGNGIDTAYGKSGGMWSCGFHTGVDFAASQGTAIYAPIAGQIRHRNYGSSLGNHQFAISPDPGQPFADGEVHFSHTYDRPPDGKYVEIGDLLAHVGAEGNTTGPHLHFEYHPDEKNSWGCDVCANPQVVLDHQAGTPPATGSSYPKPTGTTVYLSKLKYGQQDSDSVYWLQNSLNNHPLTNGQTLPLVGDYGPETDEEVRLCQQQHGFGNDPVNASYVGPSQANHIFAGSGLTIVNDL